MFKSWKQAAACARNRAVISGLVAIGALAAPAGAEAAISCARNLTADVVVLDMPLMYNRLGAANINGTIFALRRDVINSTTHVPISVDAGGAIPGQVELRPDRRPRPLVLRTSAGDCLTVRLTNLLTPTANPFNPPKMNATGTTFMTIDDDSVKSRYVSFQASGTELLDSINDDGSNVGRNYLAPGAGQYGSLAAPGETRTYRMYTPKEGAFVIRSNAATIGSDGNQGNSSVGLFGALLVEAKGARSYRGQVVEEDLRLATTGTAPTGQPIINYEATYPMTSPWLEEGKAGLPVLSVVCNAQAAQTGKCTAGEIVHSEIYGVNAGPNPDGSFPPSTYPLESVGKRNPTLPNRLEAYRDWAIIFHDEQTNAQAFPGYFNNPVFKYVLEGVRDGFMINYGSGGIGSEIIANRLGVGPMHDCLSCAFEEFFLTSFAVGDPAMLVDIPANVGLEGIGPGQVPNPANVGPKANYAIGAADPTNVAHSYTGDFVKFRNIHVGKEQHVFHLHNHQWLYNPNDDNSNYIDAQGIGPGAGYTYEINFGGSGNRNKSAGDAIFHCHFYPHFAQGMWYMWRNHDTFEAGTKLAASGTGYHTTMWGLANTTPAPHSRAYPDGEIATGTPIPAIVPLPGKAFAPMPVAVEVVAKLDANGKAVGSLAKVTGDRTQNPGYPFWIAGIEDAVGQRPPTPVLDMLSKSQAAALKAKGGLWQNIDPAQADGFDGGLRRHALLGYSDGGVAQSTVSAIDFSKLIQVAKPAYYPEEGTDLEQAAMAFHAQRTHPSSKVDLSGNVTPASFITNGSGGPAVGAPFHEPCIDDTGVRLTTGVVGTFFSGETMGAMSTHGSSNFNASTPRIYKGVNIQFDATFNKVGYHYPQQRIIALWADAMPVISKQQPPEPLVMRLNTFDCAVYHHSNLVPEVYEMDDYQVRTPTDIIGQHIHLPKWDLTTTDGSSNGWNYEDGTLSPGAVRERIRAIRRYNTCTGDDSGDARDNTDACPVAKPHPYFGQFGRPDWIGARTTMGRWFADPVVNTEGTDRGLGVIFTHDHFGPSTHQQIGLYGTVLTEPAGSKWVQNETGAQLGYDPVTGAPARTITMADGTVASDGGPTSWQAAIIPPASAPGGSTVKSETIDAHREFYLEFSDFQHAYEKGVYVGAGPDGRVLPGSSPLQRFSGVTNIADSFRYAINPPMRQQMPDPIFLPDIVLEAKGGLVVDCPSRPCPGAISVQDPGMLVVNYRNEPLGLRVFDPNKLGPDGMPGAQADGIAGDLAYALSTQITDDKKNITPIVRKIPELNKNDFQLSYTAKSLNASTATLGADPFTPMLRAYSGDLVRVKIQAGADEEEHSIGINGLKWLQGGSGNGKAPNSGWRNAQASAISEQFTFSIPMTPVDDTLLFTGKRDYLYSIDTSVEGWWNGTWGTLRSYDSIQPDLMTLPSNTSVKPDRISNKQAFTGVCPVTAPVVKTSVIAILANDFLPKPDGITIVPTDPELPLQHNGGPLNPNGGTLVYNSRPTVIVDKQAPLHDPTAALYVRATDLVPVDPTNPACKDTATLPGVANAACKVMLKPGQKVEPLIMRTNAGDCMLVTLYNRLPAVMPDLPVYGNMQGVVKRDHHVTNNGVDVGSTTFDNNLIRPSGYAGLHPQLVALDVIQHDGMNVGINYNQVVAPVDATGTVSSRTYRWYAGDVSFTSPKKATVTLAATPVEFGGSSLMPADKVKQGQKSLVGGLVVLPQGSTVVEDAGQHAQASVSFEGKTVRDMMVVMTKNLTTRYADGSPVEHLNGEGVGIPEDAQDNTNMALNYGIEPMWMRFSVKPNAAFGGAGCAPHVGGPIVKGPCYGAADAHLAYSNQLTGGADPQTPVFTAAPGQEVRMHVALPHSTSRGSTWSIDGHVWQRDPYVCPLDSRNGLLGACNMTSVGSQRLGNNPQGFAQGGQESLTGGQHYTFLLPSAGGGNGIRGDYLFRDQASFGNASGIWGILRVQ